MRRSGLQQEVLKLYRALLRASRGRSGIREYVISEFRRNVSVKRTDTLRIEHLLRHGHRQLKLLQRPEVTGTTKFTSNDRPV